MKQLRSIGTFLIVCAILCGLIAYERYATARNTAIAVAEAIEGIEFTSVTPPITTVVAGLIAIILLVAGVTCLFNSFRTPAGERSLIEHPQ